MGHQKILTLVLFSLFGWSAIAAMSASLKFSLPLLSVVILDEDLANLQRLSHNEDPIKILEQLRTFYPKLDVGYLPAHAPCDGLYTPAFNGDPPNARPRLDIKEGSPKDCLLHEALHFFIDRAQLNQWSTETVAKGRSLLQWKNHQFQEFLKAAQSAKRESPAAARAHAKMALHMLEGFMNEEGAEIEIILYLFKNRNALGLDARSLVNQYAHLEDNFNQAVLRLSRFNEDTVPFIAHTAGLEAEPVLSRFKQIALRMADVVSYLQSADCAELLSHARRLPETR